MKKIITVLSLFLCLSVKAQQVVIPIDTTTNSVSYSEVVKVDSASKDILYTRAKQWFAITFTASNYVVQMDDKQSGKIIGKGSEPLVYSYALTKQNYHANYTISITVKDGRYRYEVSDISVPDDNVLGYHLTLNDIVITGRTSMEKTKKDNGEYRNRFKGYVFETDKFINSLIDGLKKAMAVKVNNSKDNF